jgi:sulfur-carrier protein adenylyltransferase/sulfurtransferase
MSHSETDLAVAQDLTARAGSFDRESLDRVETLQYGRQLILPEVGIDGQLALRRARVLVVGAGGLGSPVLLYLAAAGVGTLGVVEHDRIERSNLHRQVLFDAAAVGRPKIDTAVQRIQALNPFVTVEGHALQLGLDNALELIAKYDIVVDATDNFAARYLINDSCVLLGKPNVSASILRFEGQLSVFYPGRGPCYRCLYPSPPPRDLAPSCAEAGVLGVLPGIFGSLQANEVLKLILGAGECLIGRLLLLDALAMEFKTLRIARGRDCAVCSPGAARRGLSAIEHVCALQPETAQLSAKEVPGITPVELRQRLESGRPIFLLDVRDPNEYELARVTGALLIPLPCLHERLRDIPTDLPVVCICHKGNRSRRAAEILSTAGYSDVFTLEGGLDEWSRQIDASVAQY